MLHCLHVSPPTLKFVLLTGVPVRLIPSNIQRGIHPGNLQMFKSDDSELFFSVA
jgi:hypothetical protein